MRKLLISICMLIMIVSLFGTSPTTLPLRFSVDPTGIGLSTTPADNQMVLHYYSVFRPSTSVEPYEITDDRFDITTDPDIPQFDGGYDDPDYPVFIFKTNDRIAFFFGDTMHNWDVDNHGDAVYNENGCEIASVSGYLDVDIDGPHLLELGYRCSSPGDFEPMQTINTDGTDATAWNWTYEVPFIGTDTPDFQLTVSDRGCAGVTGDISFEVIGVHDSPPASPSELFTSPSLTSRSMVSLFDSWNEVGDFYDDPSTPYYDDPLFMTISEYDPSSLTHLDDGAYTFYIEIPEDDYENQLDRQANHLVSVTDLELDPHEYRFFNGLPTDDLVALDNARYHKWPFYIDTEPPEVYCDFDFETFTEEERGCLDDFPEDLVFLLGDNLSGVNGTATYSLQIITYNDETVVDDFSATSPTATTGLPSFVTSSTETYLDFPSDPWYSTYGYLAGRENAFGPSGDRFYIGEALKEHYFHEFLIYNELDPSAGLVGMSSGAFDHLEITYSGLSDNVSCGDNISSDFVFDFYFDIDHFEFYENLDDCICFDGTDINLEFGYFDATDLYEEIPTLSDIEVAWRERPSTDPLVPTSAEASISGEGGLDIRLLGFGSLTPSDHFQIDVCIKLEEHCGNENIVIGDDYTYDASTGWYCWIVDVHSATDPYVSDCINSETFIHRHEYTNDDDFWDTDGELGDDDIDPIDVDYCVPCFRVFDDGCSGVKMKVGGVDGTRTSWEIDLLPSMTVPTTISANLYGGGSETFNVQFFGDFYEVSMVDPPSLASDGYWSIDPVSCEDIYQISFHTNCPSSTEPFASWTVHYDKTQPVITTRTDRIGINYLRDAPADMCPYTVSDIWLKATDECAGTSYGVNISELAIFDRVAGSIVRSEPVPVFEIGYHLYYEFVADGMGYRLYAISKAYDHGTGYRNPLWDLLRDDFDTDAIDDIESLIYSSTARNQYCIKVTAVASDFAGFCDNNSNRTTYSFDLDINWLTLGRLHPGYTGISDCISAIPSDIAFCMFSDILPSDGTVTDIYPMTYEDANTYLDADPVVTVVSGGQTKLDNVKLTYCDLSDGAVTVHTASDNYMGISSSATEIAPTVATDHNSVDVLSDITGYDENFQEFDESGSITLTIPTTSFGTNPLLAFESMYIDNYNTGSNVLVEKYDGSSWTSLGELPSRLNQQMSYIEIGSVSGGTVDLRISWKGSLYINKVHAVSSSYLVNMNYLTLSGAYTNGQSISSTSITSIDQNYMILNSGEYVNVQFTAAPALASGYERFYFIETTSERTNGEMPETEPYVKPSYNSEYTVSSDIRSFQKGDTDEKLVQDMVELAFSPEEVSGKYQIELAELGSGDNNFDNVKLYGVDRTSSYVSEATNDANIVQFDPTTAIDPSSAVNSSSDNILPYFTEKEAFSYISSGTEEITLQFPLTGVTVSNPVLELETPMLSNDAEIEVKAYVSGVWESQGIIRNRAISDKTYISIPTTGIGDPLQVKLFIDGAHYLDYARLYPSTTTLTPTEFTLYSATHSELGNVMQEISTEDMLTTPVLANEYIDLEFTSDGGPGAGYERDFYFESKGYDNSWFGDNHVDVAVSSNTVTVTDLATSTALANATVIVYGTSTVTGVTNASGQFTDASIVLDNSTKILVLKSEYVPFTIYPYGTMSSDEILFGDIHLYGDLTVGTTSELKILSGTKFMFEPESDLSSSGTSTTLGELIVKGELIVEGKENEEAMFTSAPGGSVSDQWYAIVVQNGGEIHVDHAEIENANYSVLAVTDPSEVELTNVNLSDPIKVNYSQSTHSRIFKGDGITTTSTITLLDLGLSCYLRNSLLDGNDVVQTPLTFNNKSAAGEFELTNTEIREFTDKAINASNTEMVMSDCHIHDSYGNGSYGIYADNASDITMTGSTVEECNVNVYVANGSNFWAGDTDPDGEAGNTIQNATSYLVRNANKAPEIYCQNVYWGSDYGPDAQQIVHGGSKVYYFPWTGDSRYDCSLPNVHCVPCEYNSISSAIAAVSSASDIVYIQSGTYTPNGSIAVNNPMYITGESPTETIIDGQGVQSVFTTTSLASGNDIHVSDLKIYDGYDNGTGLTTSGGGAWRVINSDGTVYFDNVIFEDCATYSQGGAIWSYYSPIDVNNCVFTGNTCTNGGGSIEGREGESCYITNSTFYNNSGNYGGAIRLLYKTNNLIENNVIYNNSSARTGNVTLQFTTNKIYHNTLYDNDATLFHGALTLTGGYCDSKILGNLFYGNTGAEADDIGMHVNSTYDFLYNLLDITGVYNWSYADANIGNFTSAPGFVDAATYDLRLDALSACIDVSPDTLDADTTDHDGTPKDTLPDVGAYEYPDGGYGRAATQWNDPTPENVPTVVELGSPVPNPFNSTVSIDFLVREESDLEITIHDINGKLIRTMIDENVQSGHWATTWDGRDNAMNLMTSGVYFIKLNVNGRTVESKSVTLIK